jgi:hypothetical protein
MKVIILLSLFNLFLPATLFSFNFNGFKIYEIIFGDDHLFFVKKNPLLINDISWFPKNKCESMAEELDIMEKSFIICQKKNNRALCQTVKNQILFSSKEENYINPPPLFPQERVFKISVKKLNKYKLYNEILRRRPELSKNKVIALNQFKFSLPQSYSFELLPNSLFRRASLLAPELLEVLNINQKNKPVLKFNNRFLACDIDSKMAVLSFTFKEKIYYTKPAPRKILREIFTLYSNVKSSLSSLNKSEKKHPSVKAALVGYFVGQEISNSSLRDSYKIADIIMAFFSQNKSELFIEEFKNLKSLNESSLFNKNHNALVSTEWCF